MTKDKERDDAMIAEIVELLQAVRPLMQGVPRYEIHDEVDAMLAKLKPAPKPDRAEVCWQEAQDAFDDGPENSKCKAAYATIRRHFDELRAEWEAEQPAVVAPEDDWSKGKEDCDGNELVTFRKDDLVKHMTNRFLGWRLPEDFRPDDGISFEPFFNVEWNAKQGKPPQRRTPTGTNLFTSTQAEAMVRYIIDGAKGDE